MKRKLASVQRIVAIQPIPGADAIEAVTIQGWQCVVKKGSFAVGDRGVYFEIDAVPPDASAYRFLWTAKGGPEVDGAEARARSGFAPRSRRRLLPGRLSFKAISNAYLLKERD
jgi:RNA ligase (TIGR02306 family)